VADNQVALQTLSKYFTRARRTNTTDNGFPTRQGVLAGVSAAGVVTEPTGIGDAAAQTTSAVFDLTDPAEGGLAENLVIICPFAVGADNNTFSVRVIGWRIAYDRQKPHGKYPPEVSDAVWIPVLLCEVLCTVSANAHGAAGGVVLATELFADTIAVVGTSGKDGQNIDINSPANDANAGCLVVDMKGFQKLELTFTTGGVATSCNALVAMY
jgi:hypothetical protein